MPLRRQAKGEFDRRKNRLNIKELIGRLHQTQHRSLRSLDDPIKQPTSQSFSIADSIIFLSHMRIAIWVDIDRKDHCLLTERDPRLSGLKADCHSLIKINTVLSTSDVDQVLRRPLCCIVVRETRKTSMSRDLRKDRPIVAYHP